MYADRRASLVTLTLVLLGLLLVAVIVWVAQR